MSRVSLFILVFSGSVVEAIPVPGGCDNVVGAIGGVVGSGGMPVTNWSSWAICWAALGFGGMVVFFPLWRVIRGVAMVVSG